MSQRNRVKRISLFGWGFLLFLAVCVLPMSIAQNTQNESPKTEPVKEKPAEISAAKISADRLSVTEIDVDKIESTGNSTVMITGEKTDAPSDGIGAGVIIDSRGYIVTFYHVIEG